MPKRDTKLVYVSIIVDDLAARKDPNRTDSIAVQCATEEEIDELLKMIKVFRERTRHGKPKTS